MADVIVDPYSKQSKEQRETVVEEIKTAAAAVNEGSKHVAGFFTVFLLVAAYFAITVASTTDLMMLYQSPLPLPVLGVTLPLELFYVAFPIVFLCLHVNLVIHVRMVHRQVVQFERVLAKLRPVGEESSDDVDDLAKQYQDLTFPFFLNRALHSRSGRANSFHLLILLMFISTTVAVPVSLFIFTILRFLPYHSEFITIVEKLTFLSDLCVVYFSQILWLNKLYQRNASPLPETDSKPAARRRRIKFRMPLFKHRKFIPVVILPYLTTTLLLSVPYADSVKRTYHLHNWVIFGSFEDWLNRHVHRNLVILGENIGKDFPTPKERAAAPNYITAWLKEATTFDLGGRNLDYATFVDCNFYKVRFEFTSMFEMQTPLCGFQDCSLLSIDPQHPFFMGARFERCIFESVSMKQADLYEASFNRCSLHNVRFVTSNVKRAKLVDTTCAKVTINDIDLANPNEDDQVVSGEFLSNLRFEKAVPSLPRKSQVPLSAK